MRKIRITGMAVAAAVAVLLAGCGSPEHAATPHRTTTSTPKPTHTAPALSAAEQTFVSEMRDRFNFGSSVKDSDLLAFGHATCLAARDEGQAEAQREARQDFTNMTATTAYNMVRTAEKDLCPSEVPKQRWHVIARYEVTGMGSSAPFRIRPGSSVLKVTYSYSGNATYGSADNYAADLVSSTDDISLANDIAASGGKTTMAYPDLSFGGSRLYHIEVQMADSTTVSSFVIKQRY